MDYLHSDCDIREASRRHASMEIRDYVVGETLKMHLAGRLDAYWSERVAGQIESAIRHGHKHIRLNLAELLYLSSAGVETLMRYCQELERIEGSLQVTSPTDSVRHVLSLSGLDALIAANVPAAGEAQLSTVEAGGVRFEVSSTAGAPPVRCQKVAPGRGRTVACRRDGLIVGVGALVGAINGELLGPVLGIGGAAICLPPDTNGTPDYLLTAGSFTPEIAIDSGILCEGALTVRAAFGADVTVGELAAAALEILGSDIGAVAIFGNSASGEPMIAAGVAARTSHKSLGALMEPLTTAPWPAGRLCGAVFSGGPVCAFDGEVAGAIDAIFRDRFGSRAPQHILPADQVSMSWLAEGCVFAGAITNIL
jgi:anti-anti-sigma factor